ncbi:MAG: ABC transporter substrate-binding protein, partial [Anaerolineae bacterium]|nr:ABC transporter substrate-binding protein [Anaerolineae bacterium]
MNRAGTAIGYRAAAAVVLAIAEALAITIVPAITIVMVAVLLTGCAGDASSDAQVLQIGVVAPFSGDYESLGRSVRDSVLLAAEAWNQQGGVLGFEVQVVLEDTACDYQGGRVAAEAAIDAGAPFLIGAVCASASEGVAQVATTAGVLQITP